MAHLLEVDIEKTLIFQGITLDIIGRNHASKAIRYHRCHRHDEKWKKYRFLAPRSAMIQRKQSTLGYQPDVWKKWE